MLHSDFFTAIMWINPLERCELCNITNGLISYARFLSSIILRLSGAIIICIINCVAHARHSTVDYAVFYILSVLCTRNFGSTRLAQWSYKHEVCLATSSRTYPTGARKQGYACNVHVYIRMQREIKKPRNSVILHQDIHSKDKTV